MPKKTDANAFLNNTGLKNCLLNNFNSLSVRADHGELWENILFHQLAEKHNLDDIKFWRTSAGNEVDFILPNENPPQAIEAKYSETQVRESKYKMFRTNYPEFLFSFKWMEPFTEEVFR